MALERPTYPIPAIAIFGIRLKREQFLEGQIYRVLAAIGRY